MDIRICEIAPESVHFWQPFGTSNGWDQVLCAYCLEGATLSDAQGKLQNPDNPNEQ